MEMKQMSYCSRLKKTLSGITDTFTRITQRISNYSASIGVSQMTIRDGAAYRNDHLLRRLRHHSGPVGGLGDMGG